ncbi:hypothetical protein EFY76_25145, partial [Salmonella enterica]|nr:hypothetical protein [Salmonella enterica]EBD4978861.1 hypothetical protein [Salmonella enterica]EFS0483904.1 hypothetical protein [Salmonella enterica]EHM3682817.1 hypothetical protein [Salmonella enterica]EJW7250433.1 hypothetical protein [Salmonella enterica]
MLKSVPGKSSTAVIYIGQKRYQELAKQAREISYLSESNIRPSTFLQFLIDEFGEQARNRMLKRLL